MLDSITFRRYESGDESAVQSLHEDTEKAIGRKMDLPPAMDEHPVLVCEVAEKDGEVVGGIFLDSVPECCMFGRDPMVTAATVKHAPEVLRKLGECGFKVVRMLVPKSLHEDERAHIRKELEAAGFSPTDELYEHYIVRLSGGVNG